MRILDAAEQLIASDGFDATPTARIAARAKVAKGLLFYYFLARSTCCAACSPSGCPRRRCASPRGIAQRGDMPGSLVRLAQSFSLTQSQSPEVTTIVVPRGGHASRGGPAPPGAAGRTGRPHRAGTRRGEPEGLGSESASRRRRHLRRRAAARRERAPVERPAARLDAAARIVAAWPSHRGLDGLGLRAHAGLELLGLVSGPLAFGSRGGRGCCRRHDVRLGGRASSASRPECWAPSRARPARAIGRHDRQPHQCVEQVARCRHSGAVRHVDAEGVAHEPRRNVERLRPRRRPPGRRDRARRQW